MNVTEWFYLKVEPFCGNRKEMKNARRYYLKYNILFWFAAFAFYSAFWINGKSFVWTADGYSQHLRAYVYYAKWLRTVAHNIFVLHEFNIPTYGLSIGYGADVLTTLQYYCIGEPLTLLSVLVPVKYMHYFYAACIYLRLYFAGLFFSKLCLELRVINNDWNLLAAVFVYVFSTYSLSGISHPFFLIPLVTTPLIVIGIERIWKGTDYKFYVLAIFLASICNFYYFYVTVLFTIIYVMIRFVVDQKPLGARVIRLTECAIGGVIGTGMGAVIIIPTLYAALGDTRSGLVQQLKLLYSLEYYQGFIPSFFSSFGGIAIVALLYCVTSQNVPKTWKTLLLCFTFLSLCAVANKIINISGESRWGYLYNLLIAYAVLEFGENIAEYRQNIKGVTFALGICLAVGIGLGWSYTEVGLIQLSVAFAFLCYVHFTNEVSRYALVLGVGLTIGINAFYTTSFVKGDSTKDYLLNDGLMDKLLWNNTNQLANQVNPTEFYRITAEGEDKNAGLLSGVSSICYFWSLSNPYVTSLMDELCVERGSESLNEICTYDGRTTLEAMAGVKYDKDGKIRESYFPLAYLQTNRIDDSEFENLTALQKQQALLEGAVSEKENCDKTTKLKTFQNQTKTYPLEIEDGSENIVVHEDKIIVLADNAEVHLKPIQTQEGELYFSIRDLDYKEYSDLDIYRYLGLESQMSKYDKRKLKYEESHQRKTENTSIIVSFGDENGVWKDKKIDLYTPAWRYYFGKKDFLTKLGNVQNQNVNLTLRFTKKGEYRFSGFDAQTLSWEYQENKIHELNNSVLNNVDLHNNNYAYVTNMITSTCTTSEDGVLIWSLPYSEGWKAYVDGEQVATFRANIMYIGLNMQKGEHQICLKYETPMLYLAKVITVLAWMCFALTCLLEKRVLKWSNHL